MDVDLYDIDGFVQKPFAPRALLKEVTRMLRK